MNEARILRIAEAAGAHPQVVRDLLLIYDWPNMTEHREWLKAANDPEIVSWLESLGPEVLQTDTLFEEVLQEWLEVIQ